MRPRVKIAQPMVRPDGFYSGGLRYIHVPVFKKVFSTGGGICYGFVIVSVEKSDTIERKIIRKNAMIFLLRKADIPGYFIFISAKRKRN